MPDFQFPHAYWHVWDVDAAFASGEELPEESRGRLWAVLVFVFYGDKVVLADIKGRGLCIPSGRLESGETLDEAAERECFEETGARLHPAHRRLIGCYRLVPRSGDFVGQARFCPVFIAEALGFEAIPESSESQGLFLAAWEDVADLYFFWDPLLAEVFSHAEARRQALFPAGTSLTELTGA